MNCIEPEATECLRKFWNVWSSIFCYFLMIYESLFKIRRLIGIDKLVVKELRDWFWTDFLKPRRNWQQNPLTFENRIGHNDNNAWPNFCKARLFPTIRGFSGVLAVGGLKFSMAQKKLQKVPVRGSVSWGTKI